MTKSLRSDVPSFRGGQRSDKIAGMSKAENIRIALSHPDTSGLPVKQLAELCGTSENAVRVAKTRAKKQKMEDRIAALEQRVKALEGGEVLKRQG